MKASQLKGLAVLNLENAEKVGRVDDLLLDLTNNKIIALRIKGKEENDKGKEEDTYYEVTAAQVKNLGRDAVTYSGMGKPNSTSDSSEGAEAATDYSAGTHSGQVYFSKFANHEKLVSENGTLIGIVKDVLLDPAALTVTGYEVSEGGLFAKTYTVTANTAIKFGPEIAIVPEGLLPVKEQ